MIFKFYERTIAEGKNFLIFAILFAVVFRLIYYFNSGVVIPVVDHGGYLWQPIASFFADPIYSLLGSSFILVMIGAFIHFVNTKHAYIRRRTLLPPAITALLFSCTPALVAMSPYYIAALCMVLVVSVLFEAYNTGFKQGAAFKATFYLTLGSLFAPILLIYLPILWICLMRVRSFNFKSFLASIFAVVILYVPAFSYFFLVGEVDVFLKPFVEFGTIDWSLMPVLEYDAMHYVLLGSFVLLFLMVFMDNSINSFKDKIRVRTFSAVLTIIVLFSLLCTLLINFESQTTLYIALALGAFQLAHFFSLAQKKITAIVFLICLIFLIVISILSLSY